MSSGSVRLHVPIDLHQHDDPPAGDGGDARPEAPGGGEMKACSLSVGRLWREDGRVMYQDAGLETPQPARVVWARPLSGRGGPVAIMLAGKKRELAFVPDVNDLPEESRKIALEELDSGLVLPVITAIHRVKPRFGNYYWDVETSMGRRKFLLSSPESNTFRPRPGVIVLKDVSGNCYEIASVDSLSASSRREMERVL